MTINLRALMELEKKATNGQWRRGFDASSGNIVWSDEGHQCRIVCEVAEPNAQFIAALRNAAPELLEALAEARNVIANANRCSFPCPWCQDAEEWLARFDDKEKP